MLIGDIQVVQGPQCSTPALVRFYDIEDEIVDIACDLLLFQSRMQPSYKLIPRVRERKPRPFGRGAIAQFDGLEVQQVQRTPEIMQGVSNNKSNLLLFQSGLDSASKEILAGLRVFIDGQIVKVRTDKGFKDRTNIRDVLVGRSTLSRDPRKRDIG